MYIHIKKIHKSYFFLLQYMSILISPDDNQIIVNWSTRKQIVIHLIPYTDVRQKLLSFKNKKWQNHFKIFQHIFGIGLNKFITTRIKIINILRWFVNDVAPACDAKKNTTDDVIIQKTLLCSKNNPNFKKYNKHDIFTYAIAAENTQWLHECNYLTIML